MASYEEYNAGVGRPTFSSSYEGKLNDLYNKIANREKFSYDFNKDAMYQLYKDRYVAQGKQAMRDTMGQAAALTGGYGSSYSQIAGQQTYQNYLQQLNDMIPTLRNQAKEEYDDEGNQMNNLFSLANTMYGNDWSKYRAAMEDWNSDRSYTASEYWKQYQAALDAASQEPVSTGGGGGSSKKKVTKVTAPKANWTKPKGTTPISQSNRTLNTYSRNIPLAY